MRESFNEGMSERERERVMYISTNMTALLPTRPVGIRSVERVREREKNEFEQWVNERLSKRGDELHESHPLNCFPLVLCR